MDKINASLIAKLKEAENKLANDEVAEKKNELGDLANLPPGHPLLLQLDKAKQRFEEKLAANKQVLPQQNNTLLKKARKIQREEDKEKETIRIEKQKKAGDKAQDVNAIIMSYMSKTDEFVRTISGLEDEFSEQPHIRTKMKKLLRIMYAVRRGLEDSVIKPHNVR